MAKEDVKKTAEEVANEEATESKQETSTSEEEVPEIVVDKPKRKRKSSTKKSSTKKDEKEDENTTSEPSVEEELNSELSDTLEETESEESISEKNSEENSEEVYEEFTDEDEKATDEEYAQESDEEIQEILDSLSPIKEDYDEETEEEYEQLPAEERRKKIIDVNEIEMDYERRTQKEGADFIQSRIQSNVFSDKELKNNLVSAARRKTILLAEFVGTGVAESDMGPIKEGTAYIECKLKLSKFKHFHIFVPYNDFFTKKEKDYNNRMFKRRVMLTKKVNKEQVALALYKGCFSIVLTGTIDEYNFVGSRQLALAKRERICFKEGRIIGGEKIVAGKNSIIKNCNIVRMSANEVVVEVAGIPTRITVDEIAWEYISSPKEVLSLDSSVDVKILEIKIDALGKRSLVCSIKRTTRNYTLDNLMRASSHKRLGSSGDVKATIKRIVERPQKKNSRIPNYYYLIHTDRGYNAIATSLDYFNRNVNVDSAEDLPVVGSRIIYRPIQRFGNVMSGYIPEIL